MTEYIVMKKYIMLPVMMLSFLLAQNVAQARNGAEKYLSKNYSTSSKSNKNKVSKKNKAAKPSAKLKNKKSPKVAKVGKKYGRSIASTEGYFKAKKKKSRTKRN